MEKNSKNRSFADALVRNHRAKMYSEEKQTHEQTLGEGAIKFKLTRGGMRELFAALDPKSTDTKGR